MHLVLPLQVRVDLTVMAKGYSTFPKAPELEFHYQIQFNVIPKALVGTLTNTTTPGHMWNSVYFMAVSLLFFIQSNNFSVPPCMKSHKSCVYLSYKLELQFA